MPRVREMLQKEVPIVAPKASLKELSKNIDANYLGLTSTSDETQAAIELAELEEVEAEAERVLRSNQSAMDLQEKFLTKKRRRIELLQSQSKEVPLSSLSVG